MRSRLFFSLSLSPSMTWTSTSAAGAAAGSHLYVPECATDVSPKTTCDTTSPAAPRADSDVRSRPDAAVSGEMYLSIWSGWWCDYSEEELWFFSVCTSAASALVCTSRNGLSQIVNKFIVTLARPGSLFLLPLKVKNKCFCSDRRRRRLARAAEMAKIWQTT